MDIELFNGDCLEVLSGLKDNSIDLILTDPPYDIKNTRAGGKSRFSRSIQSAMDDISDANLTKGFELKVLDELVRVAKNINMYFFCNKIQLPMYMDYFVNQRQCSFELIKWVKTNAIPTFHNKYLSDTEYAFYARKGSYCMPESYKNASTLYQAPINSKDKDAFGHPTIKPLPLMEKLIKNSSKEGWVVLDPFMGSGTTGVACKRLGRKFIGIELNKDYFEVAKNRIEKSSYNSQIKKENIVNEKKPSQQLRFW